MSRLCDPGLLLAQQTIEMLKGFQCAFIKAPQSASAGFTRGEKLLKVSAFYAQGIACLW